MDPMSWGAAISGVVAIIAAIVGFLKYKRVAREKLAQAEVDELKAGVEHPRTEPDPAKRLYLDKGPHG